MNNPCNAANGNKYQSEVDTTGSEGAPGFTRSYNSQFSYDVGLGFGWTSTFHARLELSGSTSLLVRQGTGRGEPFVKDASGNWNGDPDTKLALSEDASGYTLTFDSGEVERYDTAGRLTSQVDRAGKTTSYGYDANGKLASVTGPYGHTLAFTYDATGHLATVADAVGAIYTYGYDADNNLARVTYPDNTAKVYHYEKTGFPHHLTGISYVDAAGVVTRYGTYDYDANGKAILTEHATTSNGVPQESFTLAYDSDTQTTVTDPTGVQEVYAFASNLGVKNLVSKTNLADSKTLTQTFDANNNLTCKKDEEGRVSTYTYNATNQKVSETVGLLGDCASPAATPETRTTTYQYLALDLDLPTRIESPSVYGTGRKATEITYDGRNPRILTQRGYAPDGATVARTVTMTYSAMGQVKSIDGPRTDVPDITSFDYYECTTGAECGQLMRVTNAAGQATTYDSYDANGRVKQVTDPNGVKTAYTYDPRGRVLSITVTPPAGAGSARQTQYTYDTAGNVTQVITPDRITLTYVYDAALDLRAITDHLGNKVEYTYDRKGNRATEKTYDPDGTLVRSIETAYDLRNRVASLNAGGAITTQLHDAIGNLTQETDPNNQGNPSPATTAHGYDALNRLLQTVDRLAGVTTYAYDANDRLKQVQAPNSATTQYAYDDLGNLLTEQSPDRGTLTYTHDAAGNVKMLTDARAVTASYTYDALNRLTLIDYPGTAEDVTYTYDTCASGQGRVCTVQDESGTTTYAYDAFGNLAQQQKTELGVTYTTRYTHDAGNRLTGITYPDGRVLTYTRDAIGRIQSATLTINGVVTPIVTTRAYRADGLLTAQTLGSGLTETRGNYDLQGRLGQQSLGTLDTRTYGYDPNGNLTAHPTLGVLTYDLLDRLREEPGTVYTYDANGNRQTANAVPYAYAAASNRLIVLDGLNLNRDAAGNLTADANYTYTYNQAGRLATVNGKDRKGNPVLLATYTYNAHGQRTRKTTPATTTVYHYDGAGNLLAETTDSGTPQRAYAYLEAIPVAQLDRVTSGKTTTEVATYLYTDHLGTPRLGTNSEGTVVWRNDGDAFGTTAPNEDPDQDRTLTAVNLRFPGQYYDQESDLHYNWNRYYDPRTGRYVTSDPIGLVGGLNTYAYVDSNPLRWMDPSGEAPKKYEKPTNPNKRKGADERRPSGDRERNIGHPDAEEHSRRPKGNRPIRGPRGPVRGVGPSAVVPAVVDEACAMGILIGWPCPPPELPPEMCI